MQTKISRCSKVEVESFKKNQTELESNSNIFQYLLILTKMALGEEISAFKSNENSRDGQEVKEKRRVRTLDEVSNMSTKQYLDELVIPVLNKGLLAVNKEVMF